MCDKKESGVVGKCVIRNQGLWGNVCDKESGVVGKCVIRNQGLWENCVR